jgi:ATP-dependent Clp protease ATP-binding subunit ClpA
MAELRITVPDALADDVRKLNIAADAVCQRALLDSVASRAPCATPSVEAAVPALTHRTQTVVDHARLRSATPTSVDLLQGLAAEGDFAREVLRVLGVEIDALAAEVTTAGPYGPGRADPLDAVVERAVDRARDLAHPYVGSEHLLLGLAAAAPTEIVARALRDQDVEPTRLELAVVFMVAGFGFARSSGGLANTSA